MLASPPSASRTSTTRKWWDNHGLSDAHFFRKEDFGIDALVVETDSAADWVPLTPLNETAKANLIELIDSPQDYLDGKSLEEKFELLSKTTYDDFLTGICGYDPQLVTYLKNATEEYLGIGIEGTTALDAWGIGVPGFGGMNLGDKRTRSIALGRLEKDQGRLHLPFPRRQRRRGAGVGAALIPAARGASMEELVNNVVDYTKLDLPENPVRLQPRPRSCGSSTSVRRAEIGDADPVDRQARLLSASQMSRLLEPHPAAHHRRIGRPDQRTSSNQIKVYR